MTKSRIEWTDRVWNPVTGCTKVSAGCKNCYAERIADRFWGERKFSDVQLHPERIWQPRKWQKPSRIFVNSMSDLFHESVPFDFILDVWVSMWGAERHTFQILTKRPNRMAEFVKSYLPEKWGYRTARLRPLEKPLPNVWLGVSCEDQKTADERIPLLLQTPAAVRFVSLEPLLGPIDLKPAELHQWPNMVDAWMPNKNEWDDWKYWMHKMNGIRWVIVGGESGPVHRPMNFDWLASIVSQCKETGVPVFVKQDSGPRPGMQGQIPDELWIKEYPQVKP